MTAMDQVRSHTALRLVAIGLVMGGSLIGAIGLSAISRSIASGEASDAMAFDEGQIVAELGATQGQSDTQGGSQSRRSEIQAYPAPGAAGGGSVLSAPAPPPPASASAPGGADYALEPAYGSVSLRGGFAPDPHTVRLQAGGAVDAATIGGACQGFVANAPDIRLNYVASNGPLIIAVTSAADTTLVVNGPDGSWYCDDDSGGNNNPRIRFATPQSGQYDVWVGTYSQGAMAPSVLSFSEVE